MTTNSGGVPERSLGGDRPTGESAVDVERFVRQLDEVDLNKRRDAAEALGSLGPRAAAATPALVDALKTAECFNAAALALYRIGADATQVIPALADGLSLPQGVEVGFDVDHDVEGDHAAAVALARYGREALPSLIKARQHDDQLVRENAIRAVGRIGAEAADAVPWLVNLFVNLTLNNEHVAGLALARIGAASIPEMLGLMDVDDCPLSERAAHVLGHVEAPAEVVIPAILEALVRLHGKAYRAAVAALEAQAVRGDATLCKALGDAVAKVRVAAARALSGRHGFHESIATAVAGLCHASAEVRWAASSALWGWIDERTHEPRDDAARRLLLYAADALAQALGDDDFAVRRHAALVLSSLETPRRAQAVPVLVEMTVENVGETGLAFRAVGAAALPALFVAMHGADEWTATRLQSAVRWIEADGARLVTLFNAAGAAVKPHVAREIALRGDETGEAFLLQALADAQVDVRRAAAAGLGWRGKRLVEDERVRHALIAALNDDDAEVRAAAAAAMGRAGRFYGQGREEWLGALAEATNDAEELVQTAAVAAYVHAHTPRIEELFQHSDPRIRFAAAQEYMLGRRASGFASRLLIEKDLGVRVVGARWAAGENSSNGDTLAPILFEGLSSPFAEVRVEAREGLRKLKGLSPTWRDELVARLADPSEMVSRGAGEGLRAIGVSIAVAERLIQDGLGSSDPRERRRAVRALGFLHREVAGDVVPHLVAAVSDPDDDVGAEAALALTRLGPAGFAGIVCTLAILAASRRRIVDDALANLALADHVAALFDREAAVWKWAVACLHRLAPDARKATIKEFVRHLIVLTTYDDRRRHGQVLAAIDVLETLPFLRDGLDTPNPRTRENAASLLCEIAGDDERVAPSLVEALGFPNASVRLFAAMGLVKLGGSHRGAATPVLEELSRHADEDVRRLADLALKDAARGDDGAPRFWWL
jgi:HEAT repeat protein